MDWTAANRSVEGFDHTGDGQTDLADVVWLFNNLSAQHRRPIFPPSPSRDGGMAGPERLEFVDTRPGSRLKLTR